MMHFILAQPDKPLFVWQLQTLLTSMVKLQIPKSNIHFLVLLEGGAAPSLQMQALEKYACIYYYPERREGRFYPASSKPYLFARFFEQYPENTHRHFLFIESDMLLYKIPELAADDTWYWSDAAPYLETGRYEHLLGFKPVAGRPFGFHAYGKGADHHFWYKVEADSQQLYAKMNTENLPGNRWICEMRSWMWNAAERFCNKVHPALIFNDGKGPRKSGATLYHQISSKGFSKRDYTTYPPYDIDIHINENFCLYDYISAIRQAAVIFRV